MGQEPDITILSTILWISVGQEPDIRELQASLLFQLNKQVLSSEVPNDKVMGEVKEAAKGLTVLLILDDVWDVRHERPLNIIDDQDTASKLLVTTRIRGIVKGAYEVDVGTLSDKEALDLLCTTAGIEVDKLEGDEEARGLMNEVVAMTGKLTLTVAIVGGDARTRARTHARAHTHTCA